MPFRIALGHKARAGKDTFADYVKSKYPDVVILRFASPVYKITEFIQQTMGLRVEKNPKLLQLISEDIKATYGRDIFARAVLKDLDPNISYIIVDMRFKVEYNIAQEYNFTTVKIERENRPIDRDPNHISEIDLNDVQFDQTIFNNTSIEDFQNNINRLLTII